MRTMRRGVAFGAIVVAVAMVGSSWAAMPDLPVLAGVRVNAFVDQASEDVFQYHFQVTHGGTSLKVRGAGLDIGTDSSRETLAWDSIAFTNPAEHTVSEFNLATDGRERVIPCASLSSPTGWTAAILANQTLLSWLAFQETALVTPGNAQTLQALCRGLPGIRTLRVIPYLLDILPNFEETDVEMEEYIAAVDNSDQLVRTVGPVAPPAEFTPRGFLQEILALRDEAITLGWIQTSSATATLMTLLSRLDQEIAAESFGAARNTAEQAAQEAERISCSSFTCEPAQPLTSEARALLAVNLRYLVTRLPAVTQPLTAKVWLGLMNSNDQGTAFDIRAEFYWNGMLVAQGQALCIPGLTRNTDLAKEVRFEVDGAEIAPTAGDSLSLKLLTRTGTNPDGTKCPGHTSAVGLRLYYDAASRPSVLGGDLSAGQPRNFYLHSSSTSTLFLDQSSPTGADPKTKDAVGVNSGGVKFIAGNLWKEIGTWTQVQP